MYAKLAERRRTAARAWAEGERMDGTFDRAGATYWFAIASQSAQKSRVMLTGLGWFVVSRLTKLGTR